MEEFKESLQKEFILDNCWVKIIEDFSKDLSSYVFNFNKIEIKDTLTFDEFITLFDIDTEKFNSLNVDNVWEKPLEEIYETYQFMFSKFKESEEDLNSINISFENFIEPIVKRLIDQIIEAWNSERILKNGKVVWLSKFNEKWFEFIEVPYYAFACTNVSLDKVLINDDNWNTISLRDIDMKLGSKNHKWEFFLPNSLGVSVCMSAYNKEWKTVFISQERNNSKVLSQNSNKFIASASWWISMDFVLNNKTIEWAINNEIEEELWINPLELNNEELMAQTKDSVFSIVSKKDVSKWVYWIQTILNNVLSSKIKDELWLYSWVIWVWLVMEEARRNPEIIFISNINKNIEYIQKSWETAEDKDESLSIKWISLDDINKDLDIRSKWWKPNIDNHFYMSYLWYLMKSEKMNLSDKK